MTTVKQSVFLPFFSLSGHTRPLWQIRAQCQSQTYEAKKEKEMNNSIIARETNTYTQH